MPSRGLTPPDERRDRVVGLLQNLSFDDFRRADEDVRNMVIVLNKVLPGSIESLHANIGSLPAAAQPGLTMTVQPRLEPSSILFRQIAARHVDPVVRTFVLSQLS